ncbi:MAG: Gfo/Idh/MocA family oxidoreductase, partial [Verrucomicrobia bacterium]|nr:Gfo/Idh/MocA family oxidoreductase [Verrucomicrobiota bacterium]
VASQLRSSHHVNRRVAIIGHTGRGNYGHGLDVVWREIPGMEIVGVADPDTGGLAKALTRLNTRHGFSDYRDMFRETRPEFVSVCPRHADQHFEMTLAAIKAGVKGIYVEKPFCRTPREADRLIKAADQSGATIAVAHRNRYHPVLPVIEKLIAEGTIGRLLELQGFGKGDRRGGGEDLWVLGGHVFNLINYFGGSPLSGSATILQNGKLAGKKDVVEGAEGLGLLVGNEIHARWLLSSGVTASYTSIANDGSESKAYSLQLIGSKGTITIYIDQTQFAWLSSGHYLDPASRNQKRIPITSAGLGKEESQLDLIKKVQTQVAGVLDLISAVDQDRVPICDARQAALTVEMTCGVFESFRQGGGQVDYPLTERGNPLSNP